MNGYKNQTLNVISLGYIFYSALFIQYYTLAYSLLVCDVVKQSPHLQTAQVRNTVEEWWPVTL